MLFNRKRRSRHSTVRRYTSRFQVAAAASALRWPWVSRRSMPRVRAGNYYRQSANRLGIFVLQGCLAVLFAYATYLALYSGTFRIQYVIVEGNLLVPAAQVEASAREMGRRWRWGFLPADNVFSYPKAELRQRLLRDLPLREVQVEGYAPDRLVVRLVERLALARWRSGDQEHYLDDQGKLAGAVEPGNQAYGAKLPLVEDTSSSPVEPGKTLVAPELLQVAAQVQQELRARTGLEAVGFSVNGPGADTLEVRTGSGFSLYIDQQTLLAKQLEILYAALLANLKGRALRYVDLRFEGKLYYQ